MPHDRHENGIKFVQGIYRISGDRSRSGSFRMGKCHAFIFRIPWADISTSSSSFQRTGAESIIVSYNSGTSNRKHRSPSYRHLGWAFNLTRCCQLLPIILCHELYQLRDRHGGSRNRGFLLVTSPVQGRTKTGKLF